MPARGVGLKFMNEPKPSTFKLSVPPSALRAVERQTDILRSLLSGTATFNALVSAVEELRRIAPDDCDVFVQVGNITVLKAVFIEPHSFSFEGLDQDGHRTWIVIHFSQLHASIVYLPKRGAERVVTGFSNKPPT